MSASEIIKELPKLSDAERRAVFDKLCELAEGNQRWEEIIDDQRPRPKFDAFVENARAEGSDRSTRQVVISRATSSFWLAYDKLKQSDRESARRVFGYLRRIPHTTRFNLRDFADMRIFGQSELR